MIRGVRSLLAVAASALAAATLAGGAGAIKLPAPPNLPVGWSHATVNIVIRRVPHTLTYDHGRVTDVSPTSLTLREPDGSVVTIGIDAGTRVKIDGRPAAVGQVRRLETATTVTVDGGAAALVQVKIPPAVRAAITRGGR